MKRIYLRTPEIKDLKYRQIWMKDPKTMSYNAGYDVSLNGYDKSTGTISKSDDEMIEWYKQWLNQEPDKYFAYIYCVDEDEPIGEIYYYLVNGIHSMGILIQDKYRGKNYAYDALLELQEVAFEKNGITELSDMIPLDRIGAIKVFTKAGFVQTSYEIIENVFDNSKVSRQLLITKEMYFNRDKF